MERRMSSASILVWVLSVLLAAAFATTGIAKLSGLELIGLQAAAMHGFPGWIRVVVGIVEVAGALGLLIPVAAGFAAGMLAMLMVPATITQWISGEPGLPVPILMLTLLLVVAWRRSPAAVKAGLEAARTPRPMLREGVITGAVGATVIAAWFLIVDLVAREAFFTPRTLGDATLAVLGFAAPSAATSVLVYTVLHYGAFVAIGLIAAMIVNYARREPSLLLGFVVLFASTEVWFYAFVSVLQQVTPLGSLAWYNVMAGNILAAVCMGAYLLKAHPELREEFRHSLAAR